MTTAAYYAKQIDGIEKGLSVFSNTTKTADRLSSGVLVFDWTAGGGLTLFSAIAGLEASGKTTLCTHALASSLTNKLPFTGFWDAEGTLNIDYATEIWRPFGINMQEVMDDISYGFRYYRNNVIEKFFDYLVKVLNHMPDKVWLPEENTWAFAFPKRDDYFGKMMHELELKPSRALSNEKQHICPTEDSRPQGLMCVDSLAAMMTNEDEESEQSSNRRAKEASAFSMHLKRVMGKLPEKQFLLLGTNQLRVVPGVTYGEPYTEPGGNAIQFYSSMRWRSFSRAVPKGYERDGDNGKIAVEPSVEGKGTDRYMYKEITNTKNKFGRPGLKTSYRVWISDVGGNPRGIDPAFDVYQHLLNTQQISEKGNKITFQLRPSLGKVAGLLNGKVFKFETLKTLIIGEVTDRKDLTVRAAKELGINVSPKLRARLFKQMHTDRGIYSDVVSHDTVDDTEPKKRGGRETL